MYGLALCMESKLQRAYFQEEYPLYYLLGYTQLAVNIVPGTTMSVLHRNEESTCSMSKCSVKILSQLYVLLYIKNKTLIEMAEKLFLKGLTDQPNLLTYPYQAPLCRVSYPVRDRSHRASDRRRKSFLIGFPPPSPPSPPQSSPSSPWRRSTSR